MNLNRERAKVKAGSYRTQIEREVGRALVKCFENSPEPTETKLENFPKYVRRQNLTRFLALYEIYRKVLGVKGSVIDCGVWHGYSLMAWAKLSAILEPVNHTRHIYGFDSFEGFPRINQKDQARYEVEKGSFGTVSDIYRELSELAKLYDRNRYLGHLQKVFLVRGDATETVPRFVEDNPHIIVSLLFLDFDLYEPTKVAIQNFAPRMPRGAVICFDQLDDATFPGETLALLETIGVNKIRLRRIPFVPNISYARIG